MKVLVFAKLQGNAGMSTIRTLWPMRELNKIDGFECSYLSVQQLLQMIQEQKTEQIENFDLYVLSRLHAPTEKGNKPFEKLRARGAKFIYETDDDLCGDYRDYGVAEWVKDTVSFCDAVTVSTPPLKHVMARHGKPVYVLKNFIDTGFYGAMSMEAKRQTDNLTIGLVGTSTHWPDWMQVVEPLKRIKTDYPHVRVCCVAYRPEYLKGVTDLFFGGLPFDLYPALLRQIDIRLCPLDTSDGFNRSKSSVAALEAMAAARPLGKRVGGAIPICSGNGLKVYKDAIRHGHNGLLVKDGDWYSAIASVVDNAPYRRRLAMNGSRWVRRYRDIKVGAPLWGEVYREVVNG